MDPLQCLANLVGLPVPAEYRALLKNYPERLRAATRAEDGSASEGTVAVVELIADPADVLEINQEVRACSIMEPTGDEFFWPEQLIVIGETGSGDYYCIDAEGEHDGVLLFEHQPVEFVQIANSLDGFVELLIEHFVE